MMSKEMWNKRYADAEYVYGTSPNEFFKRELAKLAAGKILLPAEGEGRNAVYAAGKGWDVSAFDQSAEGRRKAMQLAARHNTAIDYQILDLEAPDYPDDHFDALALIFVHSPADKRQRIHRDLLRFLKPGGVLMLTGFSKEQLQHDSGGPKDGAMLLSLNELEEDFSHLHLISMEQLELEITEGEFHLGKASVIQLVAVK